MEPEAEERVREPALLGLGRQNLLHLRQQRRDRGAVAVALCAVVHEAVGIGPHVEHVAAGLGHVQRPPQEHVAVSFQIAEHRHEHRDRVGRGGVGEELVPEGEGVADRGGRAEQVLRECLEGGHAGLGGCGLVDLLRDRVGPRIGLHDLGQHLLHLLGLHRARVPRGIDRGLRIGEPPEFRRERGGDRRELRAPGGRDRADQGGFTVRIAGELRGEGLRLVHREGFLEERDVGRGQRVHDRRHAADEPPALGRREEQPHRPAAGASRCREDGLRLLRRQGRHRLEDGSRLRLPPGGQIAQPCRAVALVDVHPAPCHEDGALERQRGDERLGGLERLVEQGVGNRLVGSKECGRLDGAGNHGQRPVDPRLRGRGQMRRRGELGRGRQRGLVGNGRFQLAVRPVEIGGVQGNACRVGPADRRQPV